MQTIAIIGLNRIGASMGLALKKWVDAPDAGRSNIQVVGFDHDLDRQKTADKLRAVHRTQWSLPRVVQDAALIVLCLPAGEQRAVMQELAPLLSDDAIITDTAPHKQQSLQWATEFLPRHASFIAGHPVLPMRGEDEPSADLFADCVYGLFPHVNARPESTEVVVGLIQAIGAKPYFADPAEHDAQIAATSMLPALAAAALMHTVSYGGGWRDLKGIATGDLAEITRLASEDPASLGDMVALSPGDADRWLEGYIARLGELRDLVRRSDSEASERLRQFFFDAHNARQRWLYPDTALKQPATEREGLGNHFSRLLLGRRRRKEG